MHYIAIYSYSFQVSVELLGNEELATVEGISILN